MARKKARPKKQAKGSGRSLPPPLRRFLLLAGLATGLLVLGLVLARHFVTRAFELEVFEVDPARIGLVGLPGDLPEAWQKDLQRAVARIEAGGIVSIFDDGALKRVRWVIQDIPWIREVKGLERRFPNGLDVEVDVRLPSVRVTDVARFHDVDHSKLTTHVLWTDAGGTVLPPPGPRDHPDWLRVPLAKTRRLPTPLPRPGERVRDNGVLAAAATRERFVAVMPELPELELVLIDASEHARIGGMARAGLTDRAAELNLGFLRRRDPNATPLMVEWGGPEPYPGYRLPEGRATFEERFTKLQEAASKWPGFLDLATLSVRYGSLRVWTNTREPAPSLGNGGERRSTRRSRSQ